MPVGTFIFKQEVTALWGSDVNLTALTSSMVVNTLVTGLIVFKILKVFLEVNAASTSVKRTLGSSGGTPLQHTVFVIIESGMALFIIQVVRVVFVIFWMRVPAFNSNAISIVIGIHQMLNVIIKAVHCYFFCFTDKIYLARASHRQ